MGERSHQCVLESEVFSDLPTALCIRMVRGEKFVSIKDDLQIFDMKRRGQEHESRKGENYFAAKNQDRENARQPTHIKVLGADMELRGGSGQLSPRLALSDIANKAKRCHCTNQQPSDINLLNAIPKSGTRWKLVVIVVPALAKRNY